MGDTAIEIRSWVLMGIMRSRTGSVVTLGDHSKLNKEGSREARKYRDPQGSSVVAQRIPGLSQRHAYQGLDHMEPCINILLDLQN